MSWPYYYTVVIINLKKEKPKVAKRKMEFRWQFFKTFFKVSISFLLVFILESSIAI